jgi:ArsR family transcriptional regulator
MEQWNIVKIFKALSNEQRLKLFKMIYNCQKERLQDSDHSCVQGVDRAFTMACNNLNLSRSTISHHMKVLEHAGLISTTRKGQYFTCEINADAVETIYQFLK